MDTNLGIPETGADLDAVEALKTEASLARARANTRDMYANAELQGQPAPGSYDGFNMFSGKETAPAPPAPEQPGTLGNLSRAFGAGAASGTGAAFDALSFLTGEDETWLGRAFDSVSTGLENRAAAWKDGMSDDAKQALEGFAPGGDLTDPSTWTLGADPSIYSALLFTTEMLGNLAPVIVAGVVSGPVGAGAIGGAMSGGAAVETAEQIIDDAYERGVLAQESGYYAQLLKDGYSEEDALQRTKDASKRMAFMFTAPVGAFSGVATSAISKGAIAKALSSSRLGVRVGASTLGGALEEGGSEAAESIATRMGVNVAADMNLSVSETTFGDFIAGALAGGPVGSVGGLARPKRDEAEKPDADADAAIAGDKPPQDYPRPMQDQPQPSYRSAQPRDLGGGEAPGESYPAPPGPAPDPNSLGGGAVATEQYATPAPGRPVQGPPRPAIPENPNQLGGGPSAQEVYDNPPAPMQQAQAPAPVEQDGGIPEDLTYDPLTMSETPTSVPIFDADGRPTGEREVVADPGPSEGPGVVSPDSPEAQEMAQEVAAATTRMEERKKRATQMKERLGYVPAVEQLLAPDGKLTTDPTDRKLVTQFFDKMAEYLLVQAHKADRTSVSDMPPAVRNRMVDSLEEAARENYRLRQLIETYITDADVRTGPHLNDAIAAFMAIDGTEPKFHAAFQAAMGNDKESLITAMREAIRIATSAVAKADNAGIPRGFVSSDSGIKDKEVVSEAEAVRRDAARARDWSGDSKGMAKTATESDLGNLDTYGRRRAREELGEDFVDLPASQRLNKDQMDDRAAEMRGTRGNPRRAAELESQARTIRRELRKLADKERAAAKDLKGAEQKAGELAGKKWWAEIIGDIGERDARQTVQRMRDRLAEAKGAAAVRARALVKRLEKILDELDSVEVSGEAGMRESEQAADRIRLGNYQKGKEKLDNAKAKSRLTKKIADVRAKANLPAGESTLTAAERKLLAEAARSDRNEMEARRLQDLEREGVQARRQAEEKARKEAPGRALEAERRAIARQEAEEEQERAAAAAARGRAVKAGRPREPEELARLIADVEAEIARLFKEANAQKSAIKTDKATATVRLIRNIRERAMAELEAWNAKLNSISSEIKEMADEIARLERVKDSQPGAAYALGKLKEQMADKVAPPKSRLLLPAQKAKYDAMRAKQQELQELISDRIRALQVRLVKLSNARLRLDKDSLAYNEIVSDLARAQRLRAQLEAEYLKAKEFDYETFDAEFEKAEAAREARMQPVKKEVASGKHLSEQERFKTSRFDKAHERLQGLAKAEYERVFNVAMGVAEHMKRKYWRPGEGVFVKLPPEMADVGNEEGLYFVRGGIPSLRFPHNPMKAERFTPRYSKGGTPYYELSQIEQYRAKVRGPVHVDRHGVKSESLEDFYLNEVIINPSDIDRVTYAIAQLGVTKSMRDARAMAELLIARAYDYRVKGSSGRSGTSGAERARRAKQASVAPVTPGNGQVTVPVEDQVPAEATPNQPGEGGGTTPDENVIYVEDFDDDGGATEIETLSQEEIEARLRAALEGLIKQTGAEDAENEVARIKEEIADLKGRADTLANYREEFKTALQNALIAPVPEGTTPSKKDRHVYVAVDIPVDYMGMDIVTVSTTDGEMVVATASPEKVSLPAAKGPKFETKIRMKALAGYDGLIERFLKDMRAAEERLENALKNRAQARKAAGATGAASTPAEAPVPKEGPAYEVNEGVVDVQAASVDYLPAAPVPIEGRVTIDRYQAYGPAEVPAAPASLAVIPQNALSEDQRRGVALATATYDRRLKVVAEEGPNASLDAGFMFMDGTGLGKTRQLIATMWHILSSEVAKSKADPKYKPRRVLLTLPGSSDPSANPLVSQYARDAIRLGLNDLAYDTGNVDADGNAVYAFNKDLVHFISHGGVEQGLAAREHYSAVVADEAHASFMQLEGKTGSAFSKINADFRLFGTATPTDQPGQELYYLRYIAGERGKSIDQMTTALTARLGIGGKRTSMSDTQIANWEQGLRDAMVEASRAGRLVSRENMRTQKSFVVEVQDTDLDQDIAAIMRELKGQDNLRQYLEEHAKVAPMVRQAVNDIRARRQAIAVFHRAKGIGESNRTDEDALRRTVSKLQEEGKLSSSFRVATLLQSPISHMKEALTKAVQNELGFDPNVTTLGGGRASETADALAAKKFQHGNSWAIVISDSMGGTGLNLDDDGEIVSEMRPRHMMIASAMDSGQRWEQVLGRHDRAGTRSVPYTSYMVLAGSRRDEALRQSVKRKLGRQNLFSGRTEYEATTGPSALNDNITSLLREGDMDLQEGPADMAVAIGVGRGYTVRNHLYTIKRNGTPFQKYMAARLLSHPELDGIPILPWSALPAEARSMAAGALGAFIRLENGDRAIYLNYGTGLGTRAMAEVLLHELTHAITDVTIETNPEVKFRLLAMMARVPHSVQKQFRNAFSDPHEFIADAFANEALQKILRATRADGSSRSIWQKFVDLVARILGVTPGKKMSMFDELLKVAAMPQESPAQNAMLPKELATFLPRRLITGNPPRDTLLDQLTAATGGMIGPGTGRDRFSALFKAKLATMTFDQITETYKHLFRSTTNADPLGHLRDMVEQREADVTKGLAGFQDEVLDPLREYSRNKRAGHRTIRVPMGPNGEMVAKTEYQVFAELLNASGYFQVDFSKPVTDPTNRMLNSDSMAIKEGWKFYEPIFRRSISEEGRKLYADLAAYFKRNQDAHTRMVVGLYLDEMVPRRDGESWTAHDRKEQRAEISRLKQLTPEEIAELDISVDELRQLRDILEPGFVPGAYFPLRRYGDNIVTVKHEQSVSGPDEARKLLQANVGARYDQNRNLVTYHSVNRFESQVDAFKFREQMLKEFPAEDVSNVMKAEDSTWARQQRIEPELVERMERRLKSRGVTDEERSKLVKEFTLAMLDLTPETSLSSSSRKRKGILGASTDVERIMATYGGAHARYMSSMKFSKKVRDARSAVRKAAESRQKIDGGLDSLKAMLVTSELSQREQKATEDWALNKIAQTASDVGFFYYLVGASYNLVNMTQPWMISFPTIASRHGGAATAAALSRAYAVTRGPVLGRLIKTGFSITELRGILTGDRFDKSNYDVVDDIISEAADPRHRRLLQYMVRNNHIDVSQAQDMARVGLRSRINPDGSARRQGVFDYLSEWMRMAPHLTEVMSRSAVSVAAFDLEYAKARKEGLSEAEAYDRGRDYAVRMVKDTLYIYAAWNKPRVLQSQLARVALMFMQHVQHTYFLLLRNFARAANLSDATPQERAEARKALMYFVGMHLMAAGAVGGTPEPIKWLIALSLNMLQALGLAEDDDDELSWELKVRNAMSDWLGPEIGDVASTGLPSLLGIDLSSRIGINSMLFFGGGPNLNDKDATSRFIVETLGGPMGGLALRGLSDVPNFLSKGEYIKAAEAATPKVIRDILQSYRVSNEGFTDYSGKQYASSEQFSAFDYFNLAIGFKPKEVSDMQAARGVIQSQQRIADQRNRLYERAFLRHRDGKGLGPIIKEMKEFNRKHPELAITIDKLRKSISERYKQQAETRNFVYVPDNQRQAVDEKLRFLN